MANFIDYYWHCTLENRTIVIVEAVSAAVIAMTLCGR